MIITVDYGHALVGSVGAGGNGFREEIETRNVGRLVTSKLRSLGHTVHEIFLDNAASSSEDVNYRVNRINSIKPDLSISIHLNAYSDSSANGTEVWAKANSIGIAQTIVNSIAELGYRNRGVKDGSTSLGLVSLYGSQIPALLVECCFITNKDDMNRYNPENIATAIVKAVTGNVVQEKEEVKEIETIERSYREEGVFYPSEKIFFRNNPHVGEDNPITGSYTAGENVKYDRVVITNKYVWISWISASTGIRRYMPIREKINGKAQEMWGTIV